MDITTSSSTQAEAVVTRAGEKKLQERRDELAQRFTAQYSGWYYSYANGTPDMRKAIDYIIALEDGK